MWIGIIKKENKGIGISLGIKKKRIKVIGIKKMELNPGLSATYMYSDSLAGHREAKWN